jgi:ATP adenylyltransferase
MINISLAPHTLWKRIKEQTKYALKVGALQPIPTEYQFIEQDSIPFLVRVVSNLDRKDRATKKQKRSGKNFNPFLPHEKDLFVSDISDTHLCLLNKYNVVDYHLLIITRAFEDQESYLNLADFAALWACLREFDSLAFYNSGRLAGASQPHKHLQLVPLPLAPNGIALPIESALASVEFLRKVGSIPQFPFFHAFITLDWAEATSPIEAAQIALESYHTLLAALGLSGDSQRPSGAYNLLATRQWMLLVPRFQESFASISVNALGFAGALLVRNEQQLATLKELGPLAILQQVCQRAIQV